MNQQHQCSLHHHHHHHHHQVHHPESHHHHHHHHILFIQPSSLSSSSSHPHHHHHHHHHVLPQCNFIPQNPNSNLIHPPPQIPQSALPLPSHTNPNPNLGLSGFQAPRTSQDTLYFQDDGVDEVEEIEDDEDPIYVMTDEWREFFAKSEAKRREAKKLAKKQGKT